MVNHPYHKIHEYNSFYEMLKALLENYAEVDAVKFLKGKNGVSITYTDLIEQVSSLYYFYKQRSIHNKKIGIISENRYEYITVYLSSVFCNVIAPMDKELTTDLFANLVKESDISVLFYTNKTKTLALTFIPDQEIQYINLDEEYETIIQTKYPMSNFFDEIAGTSKDKFSILVFTSGTTGKTKGVMLSQYNVLSNLRAALENNVLKSPSLSVLPMNHTYGFHPGVLNTLYIGGTLCINMDLKYFARDLKYYNPYFVAVVPMMVEGIYQNILREAKRQKKDKLLNRMIKVSNFLRKFKIDLRHILFGNLLAPNLRLMVSGGAALNPIYVEKFDEIGIVLLNGYGITECSPLVAVNREVYNVKESVGTIIREAEVRIAEDGEILVKGPSIMLGYYKDQTATEEAMEDGFYKTGDIGYVEDHLLYITGRKKNLIILENGKNFSPEQIENKLLEVPYIKECIVTTSKRKNASIILAKLYIEASPECSEIGVTDQKEVELLILKEIQHINESLPSYMQIDDYELMKEPFEKNSSKKIVRSKYVR